MKIRFHDYDEQIPLNRLRGFHDPKRNLISIRRDLPLRTKLGILAHECGHWLISKCAPNLQSRFNLNWKYDLLWAKMFRRDLGWLKRWYEAEAARCGLKVPFAVSLE